VLLLAQQDGKTRLCKQIIEVIATMARRFVQNVWPELFPQLIESIKQAQNMAIRSLLFECIKKVCKKYRIMLSSADLVKE
jgi:hypothetical protein